MSEVPIRAKLRKKERMRPPHRKSFLSRLAEKLDPNTYREAKHDKKVPVRPPWASQRPETIPRVVPNTDPAELEGRRTAIVPGRVIESNRYALGPGQRGIEPLLSTSYHVVNNQPAVTGWDMARANEIDDRRAHEISTASIRELRGLIRDKYRRDVYVWSKRGVQVAMRPVILAEAKTSDKLLASILAIVRTWEKGSFEPEEWRLAKKIKDNLIKSEDRYVLWKNSPP